MTAIRKLVGAQISALGDDEVEVVMSTAALARDGHILIPQGGRLENYRANPIVLWSHDPDKPVGNAETVEVTADKIVARVRFAPMGISPKADEIRGLTKAGVIRAVSVGFEPLEGEPLDPKKPRGGQRFTDWELLELSFVSVPADVGAVVTNRSNGDTEMADRKPAAAPVANAVRAAKVTLARGVYDVASLCYLFESLGGQVEWAKWEAAIEADGSKVPAMLAGVLHDLGDALLAMAAEEIAEALAGCDVEPDEDAGDAALVIEERTHIREAKTPAVRAFRRGVAHAKLRAGKTFSAENARCLRDIQDAMDDGMGHQRAGMKKHREAKAAIADMMARAGVSDAEDDDTQTIQDSDGVDEDEGSRMSADFRRRQAEALAIAVAVNS